MKQFGTNTLLQTAMQRTGLTDFGTPDFMDGLNAFVNGLNNAGDIKEDRWDQAFEYILRLLMNRLWCAKDLTDHPEILDIELTPPVVILSLPRTGSTKLQRMLGASNSFNSAPFWQMNMFARIPGEPNGGVERRIAETRALEKWIYNVSPDMLKGHPMFTDEPEEEQLLNENTFRATRMGFVFNSPDYAQWLAEADVTPMYDYMHMQFQYLHWQFYQNTNKPFLLKAPTNFGYEDQLVRIFGRNTKFIVPHRDPENVVASITRVLEYYRAWFIGNDQSNLAHELGERTMQMFAHHARVHMQWREKNPDIQIIDVAFNDINRNTQDVLRNVYQFLDIELTEKTRQSVAKWEQNKSKNKFKKNDYKSEDFGLSREKIHQAFAPYIDHFSEHLHLKSA